MIRRALPLLALTVAVACQKPAQPEGGPAAAKTSEAPTKPEGTPTKVDPTPPVEVATAPTTTPEATPPEVPPAPVARPMYYEREITDADLEGRSLRELNLLRNTIYARIGQPFRKQWLNDYFAAQSWYAPKDSVDQSSLSALDLKNAELIVDFEAKIPAAKLRDLRDAINERMRGEAATEEDKIEFQLIATRLGEWEGGDDIQQDQRNPLEDTERLDAILGVDDLGDMSLRDLRILRNTIYARRGREFRSTLLQNYFGDKAWYQPRDDYADKLLTSVDRKNIRLIMSVEKDLGGPITDWGHMAEEGWFYGA